MTVERCKGKALGAPVGSIILPKLGRLVGIGGSKGSLHRYGRLIRYPLRQWPTLLVILVLTGLTSVATALQPWPLKILVDYALGDTPDPECLRLFFEHLSWNLNPVTLIVLAAVVSLGLFGLNSALDVGLNWAWATSGQRMVYELSADLFHCLQRLSLMFHSRNPIGDSLSRLAGDTYCVYTMTEGLLVSPGRHILTLATIGGVAWHLDPHLTMFSLAVAPVMATAALLFGPRLKRRIQENREAQSCLTSFVHQTLTALPVVQAFGTESRNRQQFQKLAGDAVSASKRGALVNKAYRVVNGFTMTIGTATVLYVGGQRVLSGSLSVGALLVFLAYIRSMMNACEGLFRTYGDLKSVEASMDRVLEVLEAEERVEDAPEAKPMPAPSTGGHVRFEGVSFGYEPGRTALRGVTFEARPGETVALVGSTGAGKSTLVSLIPRFFDPQEGRVTVDGVDIRSVQLASLRAQISIVLQEPFLLPLTVAENIAYGCPGASRDEIMAAAVTANADEFIRKLPEGYDTVLAERGGTLSGGQRQRLAIARALLKNAPVLILDEPTSALDVETEALVLEALERLIKGRTTFIIAHRLTTIRNADRIVVLDDGEVMETGTHKELLRDGALFHRFYSLQAMET